MAMARIHIYQTLKLKKSQEIETQNCNINKKSVGSTKYEIAIKNEFKL